MSELVLPKAEIKKREQERFWLDADLKKALETKLAVNKIKKSVLKNSTRQCNESGNQIQSLKIAETI